MSQLEEDNTFSWSPQIDKLLAIWCDKAKCFEWMHTEAFSLFDTRSKNFMIAINSLTAIAGLSNVITGGYSFSGFPLAWVFCGLSIAVSTLNILQDKLGYQASSQLHKKLAGDWNCIKAKIEEAISVPYVGRKDCRTFMRYIRDDIGKAAATGNSMIPDDLRKECYNKFKDIPGFYLPDICGDMEHTQVYIEISKE